MAQVSLFIWMVMITFSSKYIDNQFYGKKIEGYATVYSFIEEWNYSYKKTMLAKKSATSNTLL
jgi:hypothetical protein